MKKLVSVAVLTALVTPAFAAPAIPSHITRDGNGGYDVTYNYKDKAKTGWYVGARAELSFLNWKNKYSSDDPNVDVNYDDDKYSFESVFGGSISVGKTFNYFWRGELEGGYIGYFDDKDDGAEFSLSIPYLMANGYYDFVNGFYVGAGVGIALPITKLDAYFYDGGDRSKTGFSPMVGLMLGYAHKLDDNLVVDFRYRLAGLNGTKQSRRLDNGYDFENKIGLILDNSISIGIRYEF